MDNTKIIVTLLFAAVALKATSHHALATVEVQKVTTFLSAEGHSRRLLRTQTPRKEPITYNTPTYTVTATAYQAVAEQTDAEPFVTADNSCIKPGYSSKTRWMALSQDLLAHWGGKFQYGDQILVRGISPQLDGLYTLHDTMNKRHHHCMDILTHPSEKVDIFTKGVKIQLAVITHDSTRLASRRRARNNEMAGLRLTRSTRPARRFPQKGLFTSAEAPHYFASAIL